MKKLIYFVLILSLFFLYIGVLNISCQKGKGGKEEGDVKVIINEGKPQNPSLSLTFVEDLSITREGWWPAQIEVDDEENISVFGEAEMFIYKFDSQGNEILKKVFPKGEGPGDFYFMDPYFSSDGRLYLYDKLNHRLTILNKNCEILETLKFEESKFLFQLDSKRNMYFFVKKLLPETSETVDRAYKEVLAKFSPSGKLLDELFEFNSPGVERRDREKKISYWPLYFTCGMYKLDPDDNVYYAMSDKYEINIVSPQGKLFKRIIKRGQSRKVTKKDIEIVTPPEDKTISYKFEYIAPEHVPYIADFFILDNKYILVITHENDYDEETLAGDLYDEKGIFQNRAEVPKYYEWHMYTSFYGIKKKALCKKNHFYTIESDENEENFYVKRYEMIWE